MTGWHFWLLVALAVAVVVLAGLAVMFLAGALMVSARESAAERERGIRA